jgi:hypothetical protein
MDRSISSNVVPTITPGRLPEVQANAQLMFFFLNAGLFWRQRSPALMFFLGQRMRRGCLLLTLCAVTLSITADVRTRIAASSGSGIRVPVAYGRKKLSASGLSAAVTRTARISESIRGTPGVLRLRGGSSALDCFSVFRKWWRDSKKLGGWRGPRREKEVLGSLHRQNAFSVHDSM